MEIQPMSSDQAREALNRIEHIVIVMMENRSFDHMLGYLKLAGNAEVDGLDAGFSNRYLGREYRVHRLEPGELQHWEDPDHSGEQVAVQISGNNSGFVKSYIESRPAEYRGALTHADDILPMGYYDASAVTTYDHLAANYCVCDRWFSSVPGATWPNRLYALCGQSAGTTDNKRLFGKIDWPLHFLPSFVRELDRREVPWRWYHAHPADLEPPTLQVADARYFFRSGDHFALFADREAVTDQPSFLEDARNGDLRALTWVDPDFGITKVDIQNDDHPPADIRRGQQFIAQVVNAVMAGNWEKTLLVITYDEHGGFFDHVSPPAAVDDDPNMRRYGVRVPAMVVCPYIEAGSVAHQLFDHTSLINTVFQRFCVKPDGTLPWYGSRVANANHLGGLMTLSEARDPVAVPDHPDLSQFVGTAATPAAGSLRSLTAPRPANISTEPLIHDWGGPPPINDLQLGLLRAGFERRDTPES